MISTRMILGECPLSCGHFVHVIGRSWPDCRPMTDTADELALSLLETFATGSFAALGNKQRQLIPDASEPLAPTG